LAMARSAADGVVTAVVVLALLFWALLSLSAPVVAVLGIGFGPV